MLLTRSRSDTRDRKGSPHSIKIIFRSQLKFIKKTGSVNYIIGCSREKLPTVLEQAQQVGIMSDEHSYIIMSPDFQTIDIDPYKHGGSTIIGKL